MKYIYILILALGLMTFLSCDSSVDLPEMTEDEYPRILGRWVEPKEGESISVTDATVARKFTISLMFTPSNLCEGIWYLDGVEYSRGTVFEYYSGTPVKHHLKLVVTTPKYTTSRETILNVK